MSTSTPASTPETHDNFLEIPDDEFANLDLSTFEEQLTDSSIDPEANDAGQPEGEAGGDAQGSEADSEEENTTLVSEDQEKASEEEEEASETEEDPSESEQESEAETEEESSETEQTTDAEDAEQAEDSAPDYKAVHDELFKPFRANGKDMQIDNVEDARRLMQMGANYNKKMADLKPNLKTLKLLENHGLLDDEKLSFLIDLNSGKPEAVAKFLSEKEIDPLQIDLEKESDYKPETYTVDDRAIDLDEVLDSIKDTDTYSKTVELVTNKWDGPSKQTVANHPQLLALINDHMASGIYDEINKEVDLERALGRLTGLSDIEAYRKVGDAIQARNGFAHLFKQEPAPPASDASPAKPAEASKAVSSETKRKKRAASSTKGAGSPKPTEPNVLAMSDEEFAQVGLDKFL